MTIQSVYLFYQHQIYLCMSESEINCVLNASPYLVIRSPTCYNIISRKKSQSFHPAVNTMPTTNQATCNSSSGPNVSGQGHGNNQHGGSSGGQGCGSGGARWGKPRNSIPQKSTRFQEACPNLKDAIFDCLDYKQANCYMTTVKHVVEYVGMNYKNGSNIFSSIWKETKFTIPQPPQQNQW